MSAGIANEAPDSPSGSFELGKFSIQRKFKVKTTSISDGPIVVTAAVGIPRLYSAYAISVQETQLFCRARRYEAERVMPGSLWWIVTVHYETPERREGRNSGQRDAGGSTGVEPDASKPDATGNAAQNPLLEIPSIKAHFTEHEEIINQVYDTTSGLLKAPDSSSGEPFDPPPKRQARYMLLEISRNEPMNAAHPATGVLFANTVNSDTFWGLPAGQVRCTNIAADRQTRQAPDGTTVPFLRVTYSFECRNTWDDFLLDYGNTYFSVTFSNNNDPRQNLYRRTQSTDGQGHPRAGLLNGQGSALPDRSAFTLVRGILSPAVFTVPTAAVVPGTDTGRTPFYIEGLKVRFENAGDGVLPAPLQPNTDYWVINVQLPGRQSFNVSQNAPVTIKRQGSLEANWPGVQGLSQTSDLSVGMQVTGTGITNATIKSIAIR